MQQAERFRRNIDWRDQLSTDANGQANLVFVDSSRSQLVVANVTLMPNSQVRLVSTERPRFKVNETAYEIRLDRLSGQIEVEIAPDINHPFELRARGTHAEVRLSQPGLYIITDTREATTVYARDNEGSIKPLMGNLTPVPPGFTAVWIAAASWPISPAHARSLP
ncbi:MAG: FecR domain-containing protein [Anaerolineae bacterium]|nr:FecR domain-containing protein [Anaerolineae bacterium]